MLQSANKVVCGITLTEQIFSSFLSMQVDHAKNFIKHRILEKIEDKKVPHQVELAGPTHVLHEIIFCHAHTKH